MTAELYKAHVFVISSLLENSPNSLCEAQLVGLPCVASYAGGIPSLIEEGQTGLFFPAGDSAVLAERIRQVFMNDHLANTLGSQSRQTALIRHDPESVTRMVVETYETVTSHYKCASGCSTKIWFHRICEGVAPLAMLNTVHKSENMIRNP